MGLCRENKLINYAVSAQEAAAADEEDEEEIQEVSADLVAAAAIKISIRCRGKCCFIVTAGTPSCIHVRRRTKNRSGDLEHVYVPSVANFEAWSCRPGKKLHRGSTFVDLHSSEPLGRH